MTLNMQDIMASITGFIGGIIGWKGFELMVIANVSTHRFIELSVDLVTAAVFAAVTASVGYLVKHFWDKVFGKKLED